jgi:hypothetical protein
MTENPPILQPRAHREKQMSSNWCDQVRDRKFKINERDQQIGRRLEPNPFCTSAVRLKEHYAFVELGGVSVVAPIGL